MTRGCVIVKYLIGVAARWRQGYPLISMTARIVQSGGSQLLLADDHLVLDFPYDADRVTEVKLVHGARWDRVARVWRVPVTSIDEARKFASGHGFWISPEVLRLSIPAPIAGGVTGSRRRLRADGDKLLIEFGYDQLIAEAARKTPGIEWDRKTKTFTAGLGDVVPVVTLCRRFSFDISSEVELLAEEEQRARSRRVEMSRALDAALDVPELGGELKNFQRAGIAYVVRARRCFIADDMGTGKTIQALAALEVSEIRGVTAFPVVVVCPATLVLNWQREAAKWLPGRSTRIVQGRKDPGELDSDITIVGWPNVSSHADVLAGRSSYIFDESHAAKNYEAARTKAAIKIAKGAPGLVLCLTGTPITNRPAEYASQLEILGRVHEFGGRWGFYKRYCNAFRDRWGQWHLEGAANLDELNERLRSICYVRRTKEDVMPELDPIETAIRIIDPDPKVLAEYRRAEQDIVKYAADRAAQIAIELGKPAGHAAVRARFAAESNEHLVRLAALRRLAARSKLAAVEELVEEMIGAGRKVVLVAHHREIVDVLAEKFGGLKIQGGMDPVAVEEAKSRFQTLTVEEAPVIVLSVTAASTGHTLTASQDVVFVEEPWTPADVDQTISRCHRMGQMGSVTAWHLLADGTVDERIHKLIESKRTVVKAAVDGGDPGGAFGSVVGDLLWGMIDRSKT